MVFSQFRKKPCQNTFESGIIEQPSVFVCILEANMVG